MIETNAKKEKIIEEPFACQFRSVS